MTRSTMEPVLEGTLDEIQDEFHARLWTDGLPIIPPTVDRVERFLAHTGRSPEESLGILYPANSEATVTSVAVNGVMAGCRPEYMPVLVAIVEAIADPRFRVQDAGSTPGWESLVIINGPVIERLGFNCQSGALRVGPRANTTVGRFLRLYIRNVAGIKGPPGTTDKGTLGQSFYVALAENEAAVAELGWPSFSTDRGYEAGEDVITVQSIVAASMPTYSTGQRWTDHAAVIADVIGQGTWAYWTWSGMWFRNFHPLLVMSPSIATKIAADGGTKDDIRRYMAEHVMVSAGALEKYAWDVGLTDFNLQKMAADGRIPESYVESDDPERLLPGLLEPDTIGIVVSGDPGRNQSKGFVQNHIQGPPVSRRIDRVA